MELLGSYYQDTGDIAHDGIVPKRDMRIDFKLIHVGNAEVDGFYHTGTRKLLPEAVSREIVANIRTAFFNVWHAQLKDGKNQSCPVTIRPDQQLPSYSQLKAIFNNI